MILVLLYVVLALPYSYRAIDAGVRSIDLHTLVEAGRSMGAGWGKLFARVLFPNLRSGILAASFLVVALSLGEYAVASLLLPTQPTFPVFLASVETTRRVPVGGALGDRPGRHLGPARSHLRLRLRAPTQVSRRRPPTCRTRSSLDAAALSAPPRSSA